MGGGAAREWKRWERGRPMELWQMDIVGGFLLADGSQAKALTGVDDHSRFCVSRELMPRERTRLVCDGLRCGDAPLRGAGADADRQRQGVHRPVLRPTGGGAVRPDLPGERHRASADPAAVADHDGEDRAVPPHPARRVRHRPDLPPLQVAQEALDEWVGYYNTDRPHQALSDATPVDRFTSPLTSQEQGSSSTTPVAPTRAVINSARATDRDGDGWVSRRVGPNGVVCVSWQQVSVGKHRAGQRCDVLVNDQLLQFWIGAELVKTVTRTSSGEVRKKHAQGAGPRA